MGLPRPTRAEERLCLGLIWDYLLAHQRWPTFAALDRQLYGRYGLQAEDILNATPEGLICETRDGLSVMPRDNELIRLTIAGIRACEGTDQIISIFLNTIGLAIEVEREWPESADPEGTWPDLTAELVLVRLGLGRAGSAALIQTLASILLVEPWGWVSSDTSAPNWRFTIGRQVRRFRGIADLNDYWDRRKPNAPASSASDQAAVEGAGETSVRTARRQRRIFVRSIQWLVVAVCTAIIAAAASFIVPRSIRRN